MKMQFRKSPATFRFEQMSKQRIDYQKLPGGGQRARLTVTLAGHSRPFTFVEDVTPAAAQAYQRQVQGIEVGLVAVGALKIATHAAQLERIKKLEASNPDFAKRGVAAEYEKRMKAGTLKGSTIAPVAKAAKAIATSKVMQTAAAGLAMIAPALGPLAPVALGVSGGIGVAGKVLGAKNAAAAGAPMAAMSIAQSAISDAQRLSPNAFPSLLQIATDKANSLQQVMGGPTTPPPPDYGGYAPPPQYAPQYAPPPQGFDAMQLVAAGRVQSDQGGPVTPAQLHAARMSGRVFFVNG